MSLQLREVSRRYTGAGETVHAVTRVSLTLEPGEMVALYGPSGSGKSTLLMLAAGLMAPDEGSVSFDGRDLATLSPRELADYQRANIGFVYQSAYLMSGVPAVENAAVKLLADRVSLRDARRVASGWLERVGLADRARHTPEQMSGGERQRVAIARALVNRPRVVLADEPTGNLDSERGAQILALLAEICREENASVLLVTHDPQAAAVASRVHTLTDGSLEAQRAAPLRSAG